MVETWPTVAEFVENPAAMGRIAHGRRWSRGAAPCQGRLAWLSWVRSGNRAGRGRFLPLGSIWRGCLPSCVSVCASRRGSRLSGGRFSPALG